MSGSIEPTASSRGLGERVRALRQSLGVSQRELARSAGIVHSHLSRIESGKTAVSLSVITKIAFALDVPLCGFVGGEGATASLSGAAPLPALTAAEDELLTLFRAASQVDRQQVVRFLLLMVSRNAGTASRGELGLTGAWHPIDPLVRQTVHPKAGRGGHTLFVVADDSLARNGLKAGDIIAARRGRAKAGDIVVAVVEGMGPIIRLYYPHRGGRVELRPSAREALPTIVAARDIQELWIATHVRAR